MISLSADFLATVSSNDCMFGMQFNEAVYLHAISLVQTSTALFCRTRWLVQRKSFLLCLQLRGYKFPHGSLSVRPELVSKLFVIAQVSKPGSFQWVRRKTHTLGNKNENIPAIWISR